MSQRWDRIHPADNAGVAAASSGSWQRTPGQRDRDRLLYSSALRRLDGVTQVVGPSEGYIFHNRLTHTLKVAQIARRLAEKFQNDPNRSLPQELPELSFEFDTELDPDVVETAALAHDLGHPPFGHVAEHELDRLARAHDLEDGFEGNAQSFRILTHHAIHFESYRGLNLTRATLNAVLKYPWRRDIANKTSRKFRKFGVYESNVDSFNFARKGYEEWDKKSLEASIMDFADSITYSIHDLDDFYRAGLIPLADLARGRDEFNATLQAWEEHLSTKEMSGDEKARKRIEEIKGNEDVLRRFLEFIPIEAQYTGTRRARASMKTFASWMINKYISLAELDFLDADGEVIRVPPMADFEIAFLQWLVWHYVIINPQLATQQTGQCMIIRTLFNRYLEAIQATNKELIPPRFRDDIPVSQTLPDQVRLAIDIVASFTDSQAIVMYRRMMGIKPGSVLELLHG